MAAGSSDPPATQRPPEERYGILALARMHKDDGRSLILYRVAGTDDEGQSADAAHRDGDGEAT